MLEVARYAKASEKKARVEYITRQRSRNTDKCLEIEEKTDIRLTDEQARTIIEKYSSCKNVAEFQRLSPAEKEKYLVCFKKEGLSIRQSSRLTGVSFGVVRKYYQ